MLRAVLLDVGGTLWPDQPTGQVPDEHCLERLAALVPEVDPAQCLHALRASLRANGESLVQDTHAVLATALQALDIECEPERLVAIRRAICTPAALGIALFPDARELLETIRELGMRCVVLSNVQVRGADEYWRDFADFGIAHLIGAIVTSHDVGFRKPLGAMFQAGLAAAGCSPAECVMVGDSELKDIEPAREAGMRTIRISIEQPPTASCDDASVTSLHQVQSVLRDWAAASPA